MGDYDFFFVEHDGDCGSFLMRIRCAPIIFYIDSELAWTFVCMETNSLKFSYGVFFLS